jgi:NitT/TauT family transport system permease protein
LYSRGVSTTLRHALASAAGTAAPFLTVAILWQAFAMFGPFPPRLFPGVDKVVATFARLIVSGILPAHALATLGRLALAFVLGAIVGVTVGMLMGRSRWAERLLLPIVSVGNPIPGLAYALFVIWFGSATCRRSCWSRSQPPPDRGEYLVRRVRSRIWVRAAQSMATGSTSSSGRSAPARPWCSTGLRPGLARLARAGRGGDAHGRRLRARLVDLGAREFLNTDVMLAGLAMIGTPAWCWRSLCSSGSSATPWSGACSRDEPARHVPRSSSRPRRGGVRCSGMLPPVTPSVLAIGAAIGRMALNGTLFVHIAYTMFRIIGPRWRWSSACRSACPGASAGSTVRAAAGDRVEPDPVARVGAALHSLSARQRSERAAALRRHASGDPQHVDRREVGELDLIRAAETMGAGERRVPPRRAPGIAGVQIAGCARRRASVDRIVGGEMIAATSWDSAADSTPEYLDTDVMPGSLLVIGVLGLGIERLVFQMLEHRTVGRWGMVKTVRT